MQEKSQHPGPSYIREERVRLRTPAGDGDAGPRELTLGMSAPSIMDDGWWLTHLWAVDDGGIVDAMAVAPSGGPPPEPPVAVLGRVLAGALAGLLDQEDGRQLIRLRMPPAADESRPWHRPLLLMTAVRWDPVRAAVMRPNELARELLRAFARATEAAATPGIDSSRSALPG
jgi:hypothetical protein